MARKKVNKSEEIRTVFADNPGATAKEVVAALQAKGIDVTESLVYGVKKKLKPTKEKAVEAKPTAKMVAPSSNGAMGVGHSIAVTRAAAVKVGGLAVLKEIVDALQ